MTNPSDIFDAFIRAKAAMDKVPELENKITSLTGDLSVANEVINLYKQDLSKAHNERDNALDRLSALEVALEGARKSEADIASRLDLVISTLRDLGGNIGAALSVVAPEPLLPLSNDTSLTSAGTEALSTTGNRVSVSSDPIVNGSPSSSTGSPSVNGEAEAIPACDIDASHRDRGLGWYDTNDHYHQRLRAMVNEAATSKVDAPIPTSPQEAPADATHPFAASTANPSPVVESVAPTSTPAQVAKPLEDASLPESPWLKWGV